MVPPSPHWSLTMKRAALVDELGDGATLGPDRDTSSSEASPAAIQPVAMHKSTDRDPFVRFIDRVVPNALDRIRPTQV
jgi:hypothetical protein